MSEAKVWVGCLGCYNGGNLEGFWIDADEAGDVSEMKGWEAELRANHGRFGPTGAHITEAHEELWVMDFEGFDGWLTGERSPMEAQRIAGVIADIEADHVDPAAVLAWAENAGVTVEEWDAVTSTDFDDAYQGEYDSEREWAEQSANDFLPDAEALVSRYFDYDAYAHDLFNGGGYWSAPSGCGVYVFND